MRYVLHVHFHMHMRPALVAQLDVRPTSDQEVAGSTPAGSTTFFCEVLIIKYFLRSSDPFR